MELKNQKLFDHMANEHSITLLESEMVEIVEICSEIQKESSRSQGCSKAITEDQIKDIATEFFYSWYNSPGSNTSQGFDDWWEINKARFGF